MVTPMIEHPTTTPNINQKESSSNAFTAITNENGLIISTTPLSKLFLFNFLHK
jgi:hypothetical protein